MTLLAISVALAAPEFTVRDLTPASTRSAAWGEILLGPGDAPRLHLVAMAPDKERLLVQRDGAWAEVELPAGLVVEGPDDVVVLLRPPRADTSRLRFDGVGWVPLSGPAVPGDPVRAAMDEAGRVSAFAFDGAQPVLVREGPDGAWTSTKTTHWSSFRSWVAAGALWWVDTLGLNGPRSLRKDLRGVQGIPAGGLDGRGNPVLAWWEPGTLSIEGKDGTARLSLPRDVTAREEDCVTKPCTLVGHYAHLGGVAAFGGGVAVPYVRETITQQQVCRPFDGPRHACDPAGPEYRCPEEPKWSCESTETRTQTIRMAWARGTRVEDVDLSARLGWSLDEPTFWHVRTDDRGALHLLGSSPGGGLRYARLDPSAG